MSQTSTKVTCPWCMEEYFADKQHYCCYSCKFLRESYRGLKPGESPCMECGEDWPGLWKPKEAKCCGCGRKYPADDWSDWCWNGNRTVCPSCSIEGRGME